MNRRAALIVAFVAVIVAGIWLIAGAPQVEIKIVPVPSQYIRISDSHLERGKMPALASDATYLAVPKRFQLSGVDKLSVYPDEQAMLSSYTVQQRSMIAAFYGRYGEGTGGVDVYAARGIFTFRNKEQLAWLVSQGYPTPDDVVASAHLSDDELKELAEQGNFKAGAFYLERVSAAQERMISEGRLNPLDRVLGQDLTETAEIEAKVLASGSPFGGYVLAQRGMDANRGGQVLAGYAFASDLGDTRASDFVMAYSRAHPEISGAEAIAAYRAAVATAALRNPQLSNRSTLARRPRFPRFGSE